MAVGGGLLHRCLCVLDGLDACVEEGFDVLGCLLIQLVGEVLEREWRGGDSVHAMELVDGGMLKGCVLVRARRAVAKANGSEFGAEKVTRVASKSIADASAACAGVMRGLVGLVGEETACKAPRWARTNRLALRTDKASL